MSSNPPRTSADARLIDADRSMPRAGIILVC